MLQIHKQLRLQYKRLLYRQIDFLREKVSYVCKEGSPERRRNKHDSARGATHSRKTEIRNNEVWKKACRTLNLLALLLMHLG